jgi:hypothetical protein
MDAAPANKPATSDYDLSELDISFDKITPRPAAQAEAAAADTVGEPPQPEKAQVNKLSEEQQKLKLEREQTIFEAKRKYNYNFFKNFAFSGPD